MKGTIIITGAANGIGKEIHNRLKDEYDIFALDKEQADNCVRMNVRGALVGLEVLKGKNLIGIINCAGVYNNDFDETIGVNVKPIWDLTNMFMDELKKSKGFVINISSVHSKATLPGSALYAMSKGAVEALTRGLAVDLGKYGIRVNCIRPGAVDTRMLKTRKGIREKIPIGRIANAWDIAEVVEFLINNKYITGECITVDGGSLAKLSTGI
jgi:NAD(P)-dependent dehydrogenase (short-subunit alcohol dehydrogenase family)